MISTNADAIVYETPLCGGGDRISRRHGRWVRYLDAGLHRAAHLERMGAAIRRPLEPSSPVPTPARRWAPRLSALQPIDSAARRCCSVSLALVGVFTMLCARSANPAQLMALRAVAGLGLGGALSTIHRIDCRERRGSRRRATVTRMFLGFPVGAIVGGAVTAAVMSSWDGVECFWRRRLRTTAHSPGGVRRERIRERRTYRVARSFAPAASAELVSGGRAWHHVSILRHACSSCC